MHPIHGARKPCKITYEFDDGVIEEYVLTRKTSSAARPLTTSRKDADASETIHHQGTVDPQKHASYLAGESPSSTPSGGNVPFAGNEGCSSTDEDRLHGGMAPCPTARVPNHDHRNGTHDDVPLNPVGKDLATASSSLSSPSPPPMPRSNCCCCPLCRPERCADINNSTNPRIGTPGPVTLFAFGFCVILNAVHVAGICPLNMTSMGLFFFYGGLAQFVGGWLELVNKNSFFCTLDVTYGSSWLAMGIAMLYPETSLVTLSTTKNYLGGYNMLFFFFSAIMFVCSLKIGTFVQMLLNFSVALNFLLTFLAHFSGSETFLKVAGYEGIVEGSLAVYVGMAFTMRDAFGRSILPLLFQKNFKYVEW